MSRIKSFAKTLGLKVVSADVADINPVIFQAKVDATAFGDVVVVDNVPNLINVSANTATPLTPASVRTATISGLTTAKMDSFQTVSVSTSETCGTISAVSFEKDGDASSAMDVISFCKANGFKVTAVEVAAQNEVIFSTKGVKSISGLTEHDGSLYQIDVASNTATVVNAQALSEKAVADFLANKDATDATRFAEQFGLITALTISK